MNELVLLGFVLVMVVVPVGTVALLVRWLLMSLGAGEEEREEAMKGSGKAGRRWRAHHDFHHPIFCVKCGHIGTGYSEPSARCPLSTNDELSLLDWQH